jgi:diguanylate cyclase (GGDEF)-like protein
MGRLDVALGTVPELPVTVVFVDLDGFKAVNDRHGHKAGDLVLTEAARRIRSVAASADAVARLGGDEFVIVFRDPATKEIERVRRVLHDPIPLAGGGRAELVASIGVATRRPGESADDVLARADQAMYRDKRDRAVLVPGVARITSPLRRLARR